MRLKSIIDKDAAWIGDIVESWSTTRRWSLRGRTPTPQLLQRLLWQDVHWQKAGWIGRAPVGLFQLAGVRPDSGYADLEILLDPQHPGQLQQAITKFIWEAFREVELRKLCVSAFADELDVSAFLGARVRSAGRLVDHERRGEGIYVDLLMYELWRADVM